MGLWWGGLGFPCRGFEKNISQLRPLKPRVHSEVPAGETQTYSTAEEGKKICDSTSGRELIFQIYLSGDRFQAAEASPMALGEPKRMHASRAGDHFSAFSQQHVLSLIFLSFLPGFCLLSIFRQKCCMLHESMSAGQSEKGVL